jgi:hypothetical protein
MHRHNERVRWRGVSESLVKQREHCRSLLEEHREVGALCTSRIQL